MSRQRWCGILVLSACAWAILFTAGAGAVTERPRGQAMQVGIGELLRLTDFNGATFGYQRFVSCNVAWRVCIGVDLVRTSDEYSVEQTDDEVVSQTLDQEDWSYSIAAASEWLWYRGEAVSVYFGGGPRFSYSSGQDEWGHIYSDGSGYQRRSAWDATGAGLQGCLGVQWAASDWLTLHAEYNAQCMYSHRVETTRDADIGGDEAVTKETDVTDGVSLDSRGVRFGASVYF